MGVRPTPFEACVADPLTELMIRVAAGDDSAFEPLVSSLWPRLIGYFRRQGADASLAEDCAQEVFTKIYRSRRGYQPRSKFVTYAFRVARNHWIDRYRKRQSSPPPASLDAGGSDGDTSWSATLPDKRRSEPSAERQHRLAQILERAVATMGQGQREVFVLARVELLRYQEIGEILSIPVGTVKSRMHGAMRHLRAELLAAGIEPP